MKTKNVEAGCPIGRACGLWRYIFGASIALTFLAIGALAGPRTSANYSIITDTADNGGRRAVSASYTNDGTDSGITGISNVALPAETARHSYVGQLYESAALVGITSTKTHGGAGAFPINLPTSGNLGIECRSGGVNSDHTLVFTFVNTITGVSGASVSAGIGSIASRGIGADAHQYLVNLTGVANAQLIKVSLADVTDSTGNTSNLLDAWMGVLLGDTTGNGTVSGSDISQAKLQSGQPLSSSNFRNDVIVNGTINGTDVSSVKSKSGTALP